jgi:amino acid transporter
MTQLADAASAGNSDGPGVGGGLVRSVGFWGLMFVSLGSIIGSGWLLGALNAAEVAGPASILSWILAAILLTVLALIHAELGAGYPVAGGTARFPFFAFGSLAGFTAGWASWLQAVAIAPIEIEASLTYVSGVKWFQEHFDMVKSNGNLNGRGLIVAVILMILFTLMNVAGAAFLGESNTVVVIWKTAVPILTIVVIASLAFRTGNFHPDIAAHTVGSGKTATQVTHQSGFMPFGFHGVYAALPAGVVFALQGFEQCVQLAGEARDPRRDISRAIIMAMSIGAVIYLLLQVAFIGALDPSTLQAQGWGNPLGPVSGVAGHSGYYALAIALGAGWLAAILIVDAIVSPAGTGIIYVGTSARLSYALGGHEEMPHWLRRVDKRGVPVWSILLAAVVGIFCFAPFPSWSSLVVVVTGATAIMYAFAPVSLAALQKRDPDRPKPYRIPVPKVLNPIGFAAAGLLVYWGGYKTTWELDITMIVGLIIFGFGVSARKTNDKLNLRGALWIGPWLGGLTLIGLAGNYGHGEKWIHDPWDNLLAIAFSLVIFYWAVSLSSSTEDVQRNVELEELEQAALPEIKTAAG